MIRFFSLFAVAAAMLLLCACSHSLNVATFNVRTPVDGSPNSWDERAPRIRKIIEDNKFDLFGVQEAFQDRQIASLSETPGYACITGNNKAFKHAGNRDAIFYRTDRLELLDQGIFTLSDTPEVFASKSWGNFEARYAVWGKFRDKKTGVEFFHFNTHLDHRSRLARENSVALILARVKEQAKGLPVILTGDFNVSPASPVYAAAAAQLNDSYVISETPSTGPIRTYNGFRKWKENTGSRIDYVFVSKGVRVLSHRTIDTLIDGRFPSDHFPVSAELLLKKD